MYQPHLVDRAISFRTKGIQAGVLGGINAAGVAPHRLGLALPALKRVLAARSPALASNRFAI